MNNLRCVYNEKLRKFVLLPVNVYYQKGCYEIRKRINKKLTYWGRFEKLEEALKELKQLIFVNWDIELLVEV